MKNSFLIITILAIALSSCGNSKESTESSEFEGDLFSLHPADFQADFTAYSSDSTWKISVVFDNVVMFTDKEKGIQFRSTSPDHSVAAGADIVNLKASNDNDENFELLIDVQKCRLGEHQKVNYTYSNDDEKIENSGCGKYTGDAKLFNLWSLYELNGEELERSLFVKQPPFMEINLKKATVKGFGGCNDFNGNLSYGYNSLKMGPVVATKKYCGDNSKVEKELFEILNSDEIIYKVKDSKLILEIPGKSAVFVNMD